MNKDKVLNLLGLCKKAKLLVSGEMFSLEKIKSKQAKLVFLASDAGVNTRKRVTDKCAFYEVKVITDFSSDEISRSIGKNNRMVVAVLDRGFAERMQML
ncbi:MAG: ribosomal L7Ae/L30e/S12e/Gadd45 family protein [Candidatus Izemoplasmatales bacterium]|nr:ribosomal L7Ae/L30e/S12e/Gadd45 family protein [Candidatus Izemoplasmatales bacterium]